MFEKRPHIADLARKIVAALTGVNDEISDSTLEQIIGMPIDPGAYVLKVALRDLERADPPILFRRIRRFGWKRMQDRDIVANSEGDLKKIARGARRGRRRLNKARFDVLTNGEQLHAARNNTRFAAIEDSAATIRVSKFESTIPDLKTVLEKIKSTGGE